MFPCWGLRDDCGFHWNPWILMKSTDSNTIHRIWLWNPLIQILISNYWIRGFYWNLQTSYMKSTHVFPLILWISCETCIHEVYTCHQLRSFKRKTKYNLKASGSGNPRILNVLCVLCLCSSIVDKKNHSCHLTHINEHK